MSADKHRQATPEEIRLTAIRRIREAQGELLIIQEKIEDIGMFGETALEMESCIQQMLVVCRSAIAAGHARRKELGEGGPRTATKIDTSNP